MSTPENGDSSDDPFKKGAQVEVSFDDEGFRGSWYTATVLRPYPQKAPSTKPRLLVQFHTLTVADGCKNAGSPLREPAEVINLRPIPPRESRRSFRVGEDVDAFHNDGWWEGIVISVLDDDRYSVYFRSSREQIVFSESQLRLHREWVYGKWAPPLEDDRDPLQAPETN